MPLRNRPRPAQPIVAGPRDTSTIQSLDRGLRIIQDLIDADRPLRMQEIAQRYDIDKASAYRFLNTLQQFGIARKDRHTKRYTVGSRLLSWLALSRSRLPLIDLARPSLRALTAATRQSAHLAILSHDKVLLVDYVAADSVVQIKNRIGVLEPLHCTAVGKAILACLPEHDRNALLDDMELVRFTPTTITSRPALERQLAQIRAEGIAVDRAEFSDLLYCVAVPVRGADGIPLCSVGISVVAALFANDTAAMTHLKEAVRQAGAAVENLLGDGWADHAPAANETGRPAAAESRTASANSRTARPAPGERPGKGPRPRR